MYKELKDFWEKRTEIYGKESATSRISRIRFFNVVYNALMNLFHVRFLRSALGSRKPSAVLEIGCGYGRLLNKVEGPFKVGADVSIKMLTMCPNKHNNNLILADARYLPLKSKSFDFTYTCTILVHIPYDAIKDVINEIKRVTKENILLIETLPKFQYKEKPYAEGGYCFPHDYRKLFNLPLLWNVKLPRMFRQEVILFSNTVNHASDHSNLAC